MYLNCMAAGNVLYQQNKFLGGGIGHPAISFWQHFPGKDLELTQFINETIQYQETYLLDLVKVSPNGLYSVMDYGAKLTYSVPGQPAVLSENIIKSEDDWAKIQPSDSIGPELKKQIKALKLIRDKLGKDQPIIETVFTPLTIIHKITNPVLFSKSIEQESPGLKRALEIVTETTSKFAREVISTGIDGLFFSTQCATTDVCSKQQCMKWEVPYSKTVINELHEKAKDFTVLHLHGENVISELEREFQVGFLNPHDFKQLNQIIKSTNKVVIGGLERESLLKIREPPINEIKNFLSQRNRLMIGSNCVLRPATSKELLLKIREWARSYIY